MSDELSDANTGMADAGAADGRPGRRRFRVPWFLVAGLYGILLAVGIPWYWGLGARWGLWPGESELIVLGFPAWTAVALIASVLASALTAVLIVVQWDEGELEEDVPAGEEVR